MTTVGIIANPASGKDIRRLVAHGSVFDNDEKVSIVRRVLLGLQAVGVERVWIMPESFGIGPKALDGLRLTLEVALLSMFVTRTQQDSMRAAAMMVEGGARCIVTLGGDGTNRVVAKASGDVPLMPVSTGTNNVFPTMIEGTIAGLAAGLVAGGQADEAVRRVPRLDIIRHAGAGEAGPPDDIALVDATVYDERFVASRAVWDAAKIKEVLLARAEPGNIGLSAIGAHLLAGGCPPGHGLYLRVGPAGQSVAAPIAPGLIRSINVAEYRLLAAGDEVTISHQHPCVLALDGEREIELRPGAAVRVRLNAGGPRVVDARRAIEIAASAGVFVGAG
ncbi:MAG: NAD(+)/NADH kinase [Ardenticatenaceae bacterium]|nr:NAD(+)/NADH kinase [Ardenticatenaceae bacterium]HBY95182.1 ATP-NAD kinase [Chloroflexota bacterium]